MFHHEIQVLLRSVPAHEDGDEADEGRQDPCASEHAAHRALPHDDRVLERTDDRVITIDADAAQVQNRGGGKIHVQRVPQIAHERTEEPTTARQFDRRIERHGAHGHQQIGRCQAHHVAIGHHS